MLVKLPRSLASRQHSALAFFAANSQVAKLDRRNYSLRIGAAWMFLARVTYNACQIGMVSVLAHLGSSQAVGQFVLGLAVTAPIITFFNMQLRLAQATDVHGEFQFSEYSSLRNVTSLAAFLVILVVASAFGYSPKIATIIVAAGITKVLESLSDIRYGHLQYCEEVSTVARSVMLRGLIALLATYAAFSIFENVTSVFLAISLGWLVVLLAHDAPIVRRLIRRAPTPTINDAGRRRRLTKLGWKILPLGLAAALLSIQGNVPRYMAAIFLGERDLGIVGALTYFFTIGQTLELVLTFPALPRLAVLYGEKQFTSFSRLVRQLCFIGAACGIMALLAAIVAGRPLLAIMFGPEYAYEFTFFLIIVGATAGQMMQTILLIALTAQQRLRAVFGVQTFVLVITVPLCWGFVQMTGLTGLGWGMLSAFTCGAMLSGYLLCRDPRRRVVAANELVPDTISSRHLAA